MTRRESRHPPQGDSPPPGEPRTTPSRRPSTLVSVSHRLSPRDYVLAHLLDQHHILTTDQIASILFQSTRTCLNRLYQLRTIGFLDRFRPVTSNRHTPWVWLNGPLAARYVALATDTRPPTTKILTQRQDSIMASPQLLHLIGTNDFFTRLLAVSRHQQGCDLPRWWSATATAAVFGRRVHPDGHGVWVDGDRQVGWFLEYDNGTEDHGRLVAKLAAYQRLHRDGGPHYPVLFWLPTRLRETNLHKQITAAARHGLVVATAARDNLAGHGPDGPVWRLAGNGRHRLRLADLDSDHGQPGPYRPGPPSSDQHPLHLLHTDNQQRLAPTN